MKLNEAPKIETIKEGWQDFRNKVIPKDASHIQQRAMKQAFYAGALVASGLVFKYFMAPNCSDKLAALWKEIETDGKNA